MLIKKLKTCQSNILKPCKQGNLGIIVTYIKENKFLPTQTRLGSWGRGSRNITVKHGVKIFINVNWSKLVMPHVCFFLGGWRIPKLIQFSDR